MSHQELKPNERKIVDETRPHPKPKNWFQRFGASIVLAIQTLCGRKGGG